MSPHTLAAWTAALFLSACLFSHTVALRLMLLLLSAGFCAWAWWRQGNAVRLVPPLWLPFILWGAWTALSIIWSLEPERSVKEWHNEIVYVAMAFWVCYAAAQAPRAARIILPTLAAGAVFACGVALYHFLFSPGTYPTGWHGGSGNHSSALLTLLPCALMAAWYGRQAGWPRLAALSGLAIAALFAVSAYTTLNRTVWLGFALQLLLMGLLLARRARIALTRRSLGIALGIVVVVAAGTALMMVDVQAEREEAGAPRSLLQDPRLALWPEILERIEARPLTGYGFGRGALRTSLTKELGENMLWHSHNLLLDTAIQTGLPGLVLLFILLGATLREGWRLAWAPSPAAAACGIAVIALVAGMLVRNMTDVLWVRHNALLYWGVVGVLLAWGGAHRSVRTT